MPLPFIPVIEWQEVRPPPSYSFTLASGAQPPHHPCSNLMCLPEYSQEESCAKEDCHVTLQADGIHVALFKILAESPRARLVHTAFDHGLGADFHQADSKSEWIPHNSDSH